MTLTYRGTAYQTPATDNAAPADLIACHYRGATYRIQPACPIQSPVRPLKYRGVQY